MLTKLSPRTNQFRVQCSEFRDNTNPETRNNNLAITGFSLNFDGLATLFPNAAARRMLTPAAFRIAQQLAGKADRGLKIRIPCGELSLDIVSICHYTLK